MNRYLLVLIGSFLLGSILFPSAVDGMEESMNNESGLSSMHGINGEFEIYSEENSEIPAHNKPVPFVQEKHEPESPNKGIYLKNTEYPKSACPKRMKQLTLTSNNTIHTKCQSKLTLIPNIIRERLLLRIGHASTTPK